MTWAPKLGQPVRWLWVVNKSGEHVWDVQACRSDLYRRYGPPVARHTTQRAAKVHAKALRDERKPTTKDLVWPEEKTS